MTAILVVLLCVVIVLVDVGVRELTKRADAARTRRERQAALTSALKLTFSEANSLRRAEVPNARARILAVDDEPVVLDVFRKILVLAGFSVDTVESGPEALTLARAENYDLVFTDLKMPDMDGLEVVKAVKHLRPDVDIAVITGFATIETAVSCMQFGAVDYVQKPFTAEELVAFANRLLIRRQARLETQTRPAVKVIAPVLAEIVGEREYCVPGGAFIAAGHTWARIDPAGSVWIGLDDFARKALKTVDRVELPEPGARIDRGDLLFVLRHGHERLRIASPLSGEISKTNAWLTKDTSLLLQSPYDRGWVCLLRPTRLADELPSLRIGSPVVAWYQDEIARLRRADRDGEGLRWSELQSSFFSSTAKPAAAETETVGVG